MSIHLLAQASKGPEETSEVMFAALQQFLAAAKVTVNPEKLRLRIEGIDTSAEGGNEKLIKAIQEYLTKDAAVPADQAAAIVESGKALLGAQAASSHQAAGTAMPDGAASSEHEEAARKAVKIDDVHGWKASLQSSPGPLPVKDLSEFADSDAKL